MQMIVNIIYRFFRYELKGGAFALPEKWYRKSYWCSESQGKEVSGSLVFEREMVVFVTDRKNGHRMKMQGPFCR